MSRYSSTALREDITLKGHMMIAWLAERGVQATWVHLIVGPEVVWVFLPAIGSVREAAGLVGSDRAARELGVYVGLPAPRIAQGGVRLDPATGHARGTICVVAAHPDPGYIVGAKLRGDGLRVPLGYRLDLIPMRGLDGAVAYRDFARADNPHLRVIGTSGSGKTSICLHMARCLAAQNPPDQVTLVAVAEHPDWSPFTRLPHAWGMVPYAEAEPMLVWLVGEVDRRKAGAGDGGLGWIFVFIDDTAALVDKREDVANALGHIAAQGRQAHVVLVPNTQQPGQAEIGGSRVRGNIPDSLLLRVSTSRAATDSSGVKGTGATRFKRGTGVRTVNGESHTLALARGLPSDFNGLAVGATKPLPWRRVASPGLPGSPTLPNFAPTPRIDTLEGGGEAGEAGEAEVWFECDGVVYPVGGHAPDPALFDYEAAAYRGKAVRWIPYTKDVTRYTDDQVELVARLMAELRSQNKVMRVLWGGHNQDRRATLQALLDRYAKEDADVA